MPVARIRRRWFQFGVGTLFLVVTALTICLALARRPVVARRAMTNWVVKNGGFVTTVAESRDSFDPRDVSIPAWRRLLGDEAIAHIVMPNGATEEDWLRGRQLLPEAKWWGKRNRKKGNRDDRAN
jgi:hypothetical protein